MFQKHTNPWIPFTGPFPKKCIKRTKKISRKYSSKSVGSTWRTRKTWTNPSLWIFHVRSYTEESHLLLLAKRNIFSKILYIEISIQRYHKIETLNYIIYLIRKTFSHIGTYSNSSIIFNKNKHKNCFNWPDLRIRSCGTFPWQSSSYNFLEWQRERWHLPSCLFCCSLGFPLLTPRTLHLNIVLEPSDTMV